MRLQHQRGEKSSVGSWREQSDAAVSTPPFASGEQQNGHKDGWVCVHISHGAGGAQGTKERAWADISLYLHLDPVMSTFCCSLSLFSGLGLSSAPVSCCNGKWGHALVPLIGIGKDKTLCHVPCLSWSRKQSQVQLQQQVQGGVTGGSNSTAAWC